MIIRINKHLILFYSFLILGILPRPEIGGFGLPLQYLVTPLCSVILLFILFGWIKIPPAGKVLFALWTLVVTEVVLSGLFGPAFWFEKFVVPTDSIQYVARMSIFLAFVAYFYNFDRISPEQVLRAFLVVLSAGMFIGLLQWIPWSGAGSLVRIYTYSEKNVQLGEAILLIKRIPGIAGFATANGGIAAFAFAVGFTAFTCLRRYRFTAVCLMLLALFNTIGSQARMGYLTVAFCMLVFYLVFVVIEGSRLKPTAWLTAGIVGLATVILYLHYSGNEFLLQAFRRWNLLMDQLDQGGNRLEQARYFLSRLHGFYDYGFGMSSFVRYSSGKFMEVEPINILVLYGITGFILQYLLVAYLMIHLYLRLLDSRCSRATHVLLVAAFVTLIDYQFFSLAYFFFREAFVGLFPWVLMGSAVGIAGREISGWERHQCQDTHCVVAMPEHLSSPVPT